MPSINCDAKRWLAVAEIKLASVGVIIIFSRVSDGRGVIAIERRGQREAMDYTLAIKSESKNTTLYTKSATQCRATPMYDT
jgi:hypothetical protein